MTFVVAADAYDRFMGRYSVPLAPVLADLAGTAAGQRVLDVGCGSGALTAELVRRLGPGALSIDVEHPTFEDWWEPFTLGVGPAGAYAARLGEQRRAQLRDRCRDLQPAAPFVVTVRAWAARGLV